MKGLDCQPLRYCRLNIEDGRYGRERLCKLHLLNHLLDGALTRKIQKGFLSGQVSSQSLDGIGFRNSERQTGQRYGASSKTLHVNDIALTYGALETNERINRGGRSSPVFGTSPPFDHNIQQFCILRVSDVVVSIG